MANIKRVAIEFGLSICLIVFIAVLYFVVPDKDFAISVFFFSLLLFAGCLGEVPFLWVDSELLTANFTPLYIWILWFIFIHDRYNNSEEGALGPWIKSILLMSLLPISHIQSVKSNSLANLILFAMSCMIFVIPAYVHKVIIDESIRDIVVAGLMLLLKTIVFLLAYVSSSIYNDNDNQKRRDIICMNNCLWILGSTDWLLPFAFLQIGTYFVIYSKLSPLKPPQTLLPLTGKDTQVKPPRSKKKHPSAMFQNHPHRDFDQADLVIRQTFGNQ